VQDRPTAIELLEAAAQFLESDIVPATDGRRQFQARVAANVLRIVARELANEEPQLRAEVRALADLLGRPVAQAEAMKQLREAGAALNRELSERIRAGEADDGPWRERVLKVVRALVEDKLRVANPRYLEADLAARAATRERR
jgi:alcohol dehydrogenase class IV